MTRTIPDMGSVPRSVAVATTDGMLHFELALAYEVFGSAPAALPGRWYDVRCAARTPSGSAGSCWSRTAGSTGWRTPTP